MGDFITADQINEGDVIRDYRGIVYRVISVRVANYGGPDVVHIGYSLASNALGATALDVASQTVERLTPVNGDDVVLSIIDLMADGDTVSFTMFDGRLWA